MTTTIEMADPAAEAKPGLIARITGAVTPGPAASRPGQLLAPTIADRLAREKAKLEDLKARHGAAALDAELGMAGSSGVLANLLAEIADAGARVASLAAAHAAAIERDNFSVNEARRSLQQTQYRAVASHLGARATAAGKLAAALEEAVKQWKILLDRSEKARNACPIGLEWPNYAMTGAVRRLVETEMYRIGGDGSQKGAMTFPGGAPHSFEYTHNPEALPVLKDLLEEANVAVLAELKAKIGR